MSTPGSETQTSPSLGPSTREPPTSAADEPGASHEEAAFDPTPHVPSARRIALAGIVVAVALTALAAAGIVPRLRAAANLATESAPVKLGEKTPVAKAKRAQPGAEVALPGAVKSYQEAAIYARTNGYMKRYLVDIGDSVKEGDVLAEIETPDLDQELAQARASASQAVAGRAQEAAKLDLARTTLKRTQTLYGEGLTSKQDLDEKESGARAAEASVLAADANVASAGANAKRLVELKAFAKVVAPFTGTITARTAEPGSLVVSGAAGQPLFRLAQTDPVRIFVNVPQLYAASIKVGAEAKVTVRELRGRVFLGKITRTSRSLDPVTHTLLTEVQVPNGDGALLPGTYARVTLGSMSADAPLVVPATALMFDASGTRVAVVEQGVVRLRPVEVDGDYGDKVSIAKGLREGELVVITPTDRLAEGEKLDVVEAKSEGKP